MRSKLRNSFWRNSRFYEKYSVSYQNLQSTAERLGISRVNQTRGQNFEEKDSVIRQKFQRVADAHAVAHSLNLF
jgi:hypothetical protein